MKIVNVGYNYRHPAHFCINRPYGSGDYILLVLRSEAFFVLQGERRQASPHSVVVFNKGTPQIYGASHGEFVNDWIHFEMEAEEEALLARLGIPFDTILPLHDAAEISGFLKSMFQEKYSRNLCREESLKLYWELAILKLHEKMQMPDFQKENRYCRELTALRHEICLNPEADWKIEEMSRSLGLSRSYMQHLYKSLFGRSITADITGSRIEHAKYLLSSTDMTVQAIALQCGYSSDVHFMRIFKKMTGLTPSQFKKQVHISSLEMENAVRRNPFCL